MRYTVTHWDTFELPGEDTIELGQFDSYADAEAFIRSQYGQGGAAGQTIKSDGADRVEIRFDGIVVQSFPVG